MAPRARTSALLAVLLSGPLAACSASPGPEPVALGERRPGAVPSGDIRAAEAADAALTAYAGYLAAAGEAARAADPQHPELRRYLADPLLTRVRLNLRDLKRQGAVRDGALASDPSVTDVDVEGNPPTVMIQDCVDTTGYRLVSAKNRKPVRGVPGGRYVAVATATRYPDGRWLISDGNSYPDQPC